MRLSLTCLQSPVVLPTVFLTGFSRLFTARNGDFSLWKLFISKEAGEPDLDLGTEGDPS